MTTAQINNKRIVTIQVCPEVPKMVHALREMREALSKPICRYWFQTVLGVVFKRCGAERKGKRLSKKTCKL